MKTILWHDDEKVVLTVDESYFSEVAYEGGTVIKFEQSRLFQSEDNAEAYFEKRVGAYKTIGFTEKRSSS
jgi:hypothetical protein